MSITTTPTSHQRAERTLLGVLLWSAAAWVLPGCKGAAPAPAPRGELRLPADLQVLHSYHFGSLVGGAELRPQELAGGLPVHELSLRVLSLERLPSGVLEPLSTHTRMIALPAGEAPIRGATRFAVGATIARGAEAALFWDSLLEGAAGLSILASEYRGPLLSGLSSIHALQAIERIEDPDNFLREWPERGPVTKRLALGIEWRAELGIGMALWFSDLAPRAGEGELAVPPEGGRPDGDVLQHECILPDLAPELDQGPLVCVLPSPFASGEGAAYALRIELSSSAGDVDAGHSALQQVLELAEAAGQAAHRARVPRSPEELQGQSIRQAYAGLGAANSEQQLRGTLLYLAQQGGAQLSLDLGLVAEAEVLRAWVQVLPAVDAEAALGAQQAGWLLERGAWHLLARMAMRAGFPLGLDALLLRHAGEVGRYPSTLEAEASRCVDGQAFRRRMLAENLLFLEDSNVAARVRAFDWLERLGAAPANFDPLGDRQQRRAALSAFIEAQADQDQ